MKHLNEYISEAAKEQPIVESEDKSIVFDFTDLENAEETLNSLKDDENCTVEENKLTVKITADNVDSLSKVQDILQQFTSAIRKSSKATNDESYAQKTVKFEKKLGEFNDAIDEIKNPQTEEE